MYILCTTTVHFQCFLPFLDYIKNQLIERFLKLNYINSGLQKLLLSVRIQLNQMTNDFEKCIPINIGSRGKQVGMLIPSTVGIQAFLNSS
jgi:hypothetical protein